MIRKNRDDKLILLTGATGYVGGRLLRVLEQLHEPESRPGQGNGAGPFREDLYEVVLRPSASLSPLL